MIPTILRKDKRTALEKEIDKHLEALRLTPFDSEEYKARIGVIERLMSINSENAKKRINPDTILMVAAGLLQVGAILYREEIGHVISSKALSFVMRGRV